MASGYVSAIACHKILNSEQQVDFTVKRLKKIYSLYFYSLLLALLLVPLLMSTISLIKTQEFIFDFSINNLSELLLYLSLAQVFTSETWALNQAFVEINGVYWFIAVMVQIYLLLGWHLYKAMVLPYYHIRVLFIAALLT